MLHRADAYHERRATTPPSATTTPERLPTKALTRPARRAENPATRDGPSVAHVSLPECHAERPWAVKRSYNRERNPVWPDYLCTEDNNHTRIGREFYFRSADGLLMPAYKDQPPPDLKYFDQSVK